MCDIGVRAGAPEAEGRSGAWRALQVDEVGGTQRGVTENFDLHVGGGDRFEAARGVPVDEVVAAIVQPRDEVGRNGAEEGRPGDVEVHAHAEE